METNWSVTVMKKIKLLMPLCIVIVFLGACSQASVTKAPTDERVKEILEQKDDLFNAILSPVTSILWNREGAVLSDTDYEIFADYFRDNDFTAQMDQLKALYDEVKEVSESEPPLTGWARYSLERSIDYLSPLIAFGEGLRNNGKATLTQEDKNFIDTYEPLEDFNNDIVKAYPSDRDPTEEHGREIIEQQSELVKSIVSPLIPMLCSFDGPTYIPTDYLEVAKYFRDNDFSDQMNQLEALYDELKDISENSPDEVVFADQLRQNIDKLSALIMIGEKQRQSDTIELTDEDKRLMDSYGNGGIEMLYQ